MDDTLVATNLLDFMLNPALGANWRDLASGGSGESTLLITLYAAMNIVAATIGAAIMAWGVGTGVIGTAHEGKTMGSSMHSFWTPVRMLMGLAMLAPVPFGVGLSVLQLLVLLAFGTIDSTTTKYLSDPLYDYLKSHGGIVTPISTDKTRQIASDTAGTMLQAMVLQSYADYAAAKEGIGGGSGGVGAQANVKDGAVVVSFDPPNGIPAKAMGSIILPCSESYGIACNDIVSGFGTLASDLAPIARALGDPRETMPNNAQQQYVSALTRFEDTMDRNIAAFMTSENGGYNQSYNKFIDQAKSSGWSGLGMYYWTLSGYQNKMQDIVEGVEPSYFAPTSVATMSLGRGYGPVADAATDFASAAVTARDQSGAASMAAAASYDDIHLSMGSKLMARIYNFGKSASEATSGIPIVGGAINSVVNYAGGNSGYSLIGPSGVRVMLGEGDPIASMSTWGHRMVFATSAIMGIAEARKIHADAKESAANAAGTRSDEIGASAQLGGPQDTKESKKWLAYAKGAASAAADGASSLAKAAMIPIFMGGWTLAYYLPAIPFAMWAIGLVSMVILLLASLAAAPFVAISQAIPSAEHGMFGPARSSYLLLMTIFIRPPMMVVGFAIAVILMTGAGRMISYAFSTFYAGAEAGQFSGVISGISMVVLVGGLMLVIAHIMFSLPNRLTEAVTRYIGQGQPSLGDETEDSRIKGQVGGVAHSMTNTVTGAMRRPGGSLEGVPGTRPGGRRTPAADLMQHDAGDAGRGAGAKDRGEGGL